MEITNNITTTLAIMDGHEYVYVETNSPSFDTYLESLGHTERIVKNLGEMGIFYYYKIEKQYLGELFHAKDSGLPSESGSSDNVGRPSGEGQEEGDSL